MDTKYEELLKQLNPLVNSPYHTATAQAHISAAEAEMRRQMYESLMQQKAMEYEATAKAQADTLAQKMKQGAVPAWAEGTALTEDNFLREIDRMREEEDKVKKAEDKKKRQKNANTLEKLLRHEFQKTKT